MEVAAVKTRWFFLLAYIGLIFWLSLSSHPPVPDVDLPFRDKIEHALAYAVMVWLVAWTLGDKKGLTAGGFGWGVVVAVLCGGALEILQATLTSVRMAEWGDLLADVLGALIAWGLGLLWLKRVSRG